MLDLRHSQQCYGDMFRTPQKVRIVLKEFYATNLGNNFHMNDYFTGQLSMKTVAV